MFRDDGPVDPALFQPLIAALEKRPLDINLYRKASGEGRSQCFGVVLQRNGRYHGSRQNATRLDIYKCLLQLAAKICPDLDYDGSQVNQNYKTAPHKDKNNRGESLIIGFGDYEGGDLVIEETPVSIKYRKIFFCGSLYTHSTTEWTGQRYSIVFFKVDRKIKKPIYSVVRIGGEKEYLREDLDGHIKLYNRRGSCFFYNLDTPPERRSRCPTLSACIELE